jgi:hypothetical protein
VLEKIAMAQKIESNPQRLVMQFGSTRLALDKNCSHGNAASEDAILVA